MNPWYKNTTSLLLFSFLSILLLFFFFTYYPSMNDGPRGIHQWAQADRLALCLRYIDGRPLNDPATLSFKTPEGKVGVEFSGFQYLIAQVIRMGFPERWLPMLYKLTSFLFFYTALFFIAFKVLEKEKILFKCFIFIGILSSPILVYYGYNFLPDILALALLLWTFLLYHTDFEKYIYPILFISGLSMLIKTSSGIYLISFFSLFFLRHIRKLNLKFIISSFIFFSLITAIAYYDFFHVNQRNAELYSVVFLSSPIPVNSWSQFTQIFDVAMRFRFDYFSGAQRFLLVILAILTVVNYKRILPQKNDLQLVILVVFGLLAIVLLFGVQYMNHDYYFIGNFMPIILYLTLRGIAFISPYIQPRTGLILAICFGCISFSQANTRYFQRMSEIVHINGYAEPYPYKWLIDAEKKTDPLIAKDELVFVVYAPEPNHSLVYFRRNGATFNTEEMSRDNSPFNYYFETLDVHYVVCKNEKISQFKSDQPHFFESAKQVYKDRKFTVFYYGN